MNRFRSLLAVLALLPLASAAQACDLASAPTSRWTTTRIAGAAWLIDPCGDPFYSVGVNVVDGGAPARQAGGKVLYSWQAFDPSLDSWIGRTRARLDAWGFNSLGGWSMPPKGLALPQIPDLELGRTAQFHWFDPFDPALDQRMMQTAQSLVAPYKGSPYRIGYYPDNEVGWWNGALFMFFQSKPASNFTKQRWVAYLKDYYKGDWSRFAADFAPPQGVADWNGLLASTDKTRLRPDTDGFQAVRGWTGIVAERYYSLVEKSLRAADPDALIFGDRLPIYFDPAAVRAEARHVDVIATNYNVDSPDGWVARYYFDALHALSGGKPVLVSEWFFAAAENRTGNLNNGHLMTVPTQAQRAVGAAEAVRQFASVPDILGTHWFEYADYPKGGRDDGEDYDFGLVDINDQPYEALTASLAAVNATAARVHGAPETDAPRPPDRREISIPYAEPDISGQSLAPWPKRAALLPPLLTAPDDVPFGEAYLAWNTDGLALASIGQDYYDLDLLSYSGAFPLSESYRIEIGVDAGAGPRRFTVYFIPPRSVAKGAPQMAALLCAGAAASIDACHPVASGATSYFGADQPRIVSQTLLPWRALGLDGPPASGQMRVEIAMTSWHRARWASLSGMDPEESRAHPRRWVTVRLGRVS